MNDLNDQAVEYCLTKIKNGLKAKGITYLKISEILKVSEITVKRMLNHKDISLSKLFFLAELAQYDVAELVKESLVNKPKFKCFTKKQDEAFCQYPHLFQFYCYLTQALHPDEIASKYKLNKSTISLYLSALEKLRLIKVQSDQSVQLPNPMHMSFNSDSLFIKKGMMNSFNKAADMIMSTSPDKNFALSAMWLYESDIEKMFDELLKVLNKYTVDMMEHRLDEKSLPDYQLIFAGMPNQPIPQFKLNNLKMGELKL